MKRNGATTLWERWDGRESNHPMFAPVCGLLFTDPGIRMMPAAQPPVVIPTQPDVNTQPTQALKPLNGELQPPAVPSVRAAFFSYEIRLSSQRQLTLGKGQYPDAGWNPFGELGASGKRGKAGGVEPCARRRGQGAHNVIWQLGVSHYIKRKRKNNMIETILEEIRVMNLPLFWLTESEHGKRTTWSFVPDNPCNDIYSVTKVFTVTALGFIRSGTLEARR